MDTGKAAEDARLGVYMRVSGDEQKRKGTIENQRTVLQRYLDVQGITPAGWYEDEAVSGFFVAFPNRPDGSRLLADVRAGRVNLILVRKLDRFGRNAREILNAVHEVEQAGARLISLKENVDTRTSAGRFFLTVLAGVAELERDMILERTDEGSERRLEKTTWMGGIPPIGYRVEGKRETARLFIDETPDPATGYSEADVVRLCFHLHVERNWTLIQIADHLSALGIPTRSQRNGQTVYKLHGAELPHASAWAPGVVHRILRNPIYKGLRSYRAKDGRTVTHPAPALVGVDVWERAQRLLVDHRLSGNRNMDREYLLRGMLRCAHCGGLYTTGWTKSRDTGELWRYYACSTRLLHRRRERAYGRPGEPVPTCIGKTIGAAHIEERIWHAVEHFIRNPGEALHLLAAQVGNQVGAAETQREELARVQAQLDTYQSQRDAVVALWRKGRIDERDLNHQLDDIAAEESGVQHERDKIMAALQTANDRQDRMSSARALLQQLHARLDSEPITPELRRMAVETIIVGIRIVSEEVGLSTRGKMKRRARALVTYCFDDPATREQAITVTQQTVDGSTSAPRR